MAQSEETLHFLDYWRVICSRKEVVIAAFLLVVLAGVVVTVTMPRVYKASTKVAVREETPDLSVFSNERAGYNPLFLRTQFEIIQSRPIIEESIRKLNLDDKLSRAYGYDSLPPEQRFEQTWRILSRSMKVQQYRDTNLIEIQIFLSEPEEIAHELVADVANEIATAFRDQRMRVSRNQMERALGALFERYEAQQKRVEDAQRKVGEIREKYQIDFVDSGSGDGSVSLMKMTMTQLESQRIQARMELADKEARYKEMASMDPDDLIVAAAYLVGDPALAALVQQKRSSEIELSRLQQSYGPKHPDILRLRAVIEEITRKVEDALLGMRTGVQVEYQAAKAKVDIMESELQALKDKERKAETGQYQEFNEAQEELQHARHIRNVLEMRHIQEQIEMRIPRTIIEVIEHAVPADPSKPVSPNVPLNVILSILMGIGAGIGLAYFIEYLDTSIKTIDDVERAMGVQVMGVIPRGVKPMIDETAQSAHAEAYRVLRTNIQFSKKVKQARTITCTSGSVGEGKSLTIFNLAYVSAQLGDRTLIVDSDLHRPRQHKILGLSNRRGLTTVLLGEGALDEVIQPTGVDGLSFLASGRMSTDAHGLLDSSRMREVIAELCERFDVVYFDAPPIIGVSDASLLAREVDAVLLVVQHRKYPRAVSLRAKSMLENAGGNLLGVVLNNINISRDYSYYYYHYSTSRQLPDKKGKQSGAAPPKRRPEK